MLLVVAVGSEVSVIPGERLIGKGVVLEAAEDNSGTVFLHLLGERRWHRRKQLTLAMQIQAFCL
jgi:hypothetical protein